MTPLDRIVTPVRRSTCRCGQALIWCWIDRTLRPFDAQPVPHPDPPNLLHTVYHPQHACQETA